MQLIYAFGWLARCNLCLFIYTMLCYCYPNLGLLLILGFQDWTGLTFQEIMEDAEKIKAIVSMAWNLMIRSKHYLILETYAIVFFPLASF